MNAVHALLERKLASLAALAHIVTGEVGRVAQDHVEGRLDFAGNVRELMAIAAQMIEADPTRADRGPLGWWQGIVRRKRSRAPHRAEVDAHQVPFHCESRTTSTRCGSTRCASTPAPATARLQ